VEASARGNGFDDVEKGDGIGFDAVGRAGQQQAEQPRVVQPVEQRRRQAARVLDFVGTLPRHQAERPSARAITVRVAGKVGGILQSVYSS